MTAQEYNEAFRALNFKVFAPIVVIREDRRLSSPILYKEKRVKSKYDHWREYMNGDEILIVAVPCFYRWIFVETFMDLSFDERLEFAMDHIKQKVTEKIDEVFEIQVLKSKWLDKMSAFLGYRYPSNGVMDKILEVLSYRDHLMTMQEFGRGVVDHVNYIEDFELRTVHPHLDKFTVKANLSIYPFNK
jgi:hypothetical protein